MGKLIDADELKDIVEYMCDEDGSEEAQKWREWFIRVIQTQENRKNEREKIAEDVADKMDYMGSCLNEKNIILGIITGKRETLESLCSICKSESCVSNGTAIPKDQHENRLKADMVAMLTDIQLEIKELWDSRYDVWLDNQYYIGKSDTLGEVDEVIQQKIDAMKENKDDN